MTSHPGGLAPPTEPDRQQAARHADVALQSIGQPNSVAQEFDFWNDRYEGRRLFSERHCCVGRSRRAGDWFRDVVWLVFGICWFPVPA